MQKRQNDASIHVEISIQQAYMKRKYRMQQNEENYNTDIMNNEIHTFAGAKCPRTASEAILEGCFGRFLEKL